MGSGVNTLKPIFLGVILERFSGFEKKSNTFSNGALTWCETDSS
jgi:hypothetical protein